MELTQSFTPPSPGICVRLYRPHSSDLHRRRHRLVSLLPPSVCHRADPVERLDAHRPSQSLPSLLQPGGLVPGSVGHGAGPAAGPHLCRHRHDRVGRGRYAGPQTRPDDPRHRHAPRPAHLQPGHEAGELGPRLGRDLLVAVLSVLGADQGVGAADRLPPVSQSPGHHQGQEETPEGRQGQESPQAAGPAHAPRTGFGAAFPGGGVVSRPATHGRWRWCCTA